MANYKITHESLKRVKYVTSTKIVIDNDGKEIEIERKVLEQILKEIDFLHNISNSFYFSTFLRKTDANYKYYHDELRKDATKYLIGKTKINLETDYDAMENDTDRIPYMQLKRVYESFLHFGLVNRSGYVLIKSLDDLKEPHIEKIQ